MENFLSVIFAAWRELFLIALKLQKVTVGNGWLCETRKDEFWGDDFLVSDTNIVELPELSRKETNQKASAWAPIWTNDLYI